MGDIFLKLLNMSITAGWFILAVLCIRLIFRKSPKWVNCLLWGAVAVRLTCPFSIESPFSILPSAEPVKSSTIVEGKVHNDIPSIDSHLTIVENTINPMLTETFAYNESESVAPLQAVTDAAGIIWVCGMILLTICAMGSIIRLHKLVGEAVCVRDHIYICDAVKSPFILGIVRPRVYLSSALSEKEMNYIIAHESAHLRRKDHWWKPLGYILLCIYWFNPLCWAAYAMLCRDIELACDEKVARDLTFHEKKEYSNILLSCAKQRRLVMVCPLAFGEVGVKERVKSVLNYRKPTIWIMAAAAAVVAILAVCFLTNPTKEYRIKITIPAGSTEPFCYSDEEISPRGNTLTFYAGEGLGDTEIILLPVEVREENAYDEPAYITPGMPVKMDVEKGAWFKIGVNIQNPTDERKDVYVSVSNVEVRIASLEEDVKQQETVIDVQVSEELLTEDSAIRDILLYEQPEADQVCIKVQPSMIRDKSFYYYIPTGEDQEWLLKQVEALDLEGKPWERRWEGHKEKGWQIIYNDVEIRAFEGGYLYYTYDDEKGMMECFIEAPKLCDYIQIMLIEKIGYQNYDVSDIKDIVSAKLDVISISTGGQVYSQTITDAETLQKFEEWFGKAEYTFGGMDCGSQNACLELTLANGNVVKLSMATDSCPNFSIDGVAYEYHPASNGNNSEFYKCFDLRRNPLEISGRTEQQDDEAAAAFAQDFINQFNGTIAGREKISLTEYIGNSNLLTFAEKMIVLTQKQVELGMSAVIYGAENEFGDVECEKIDEDLYYVKVPLRYEGSGMTCQLVIRKQEAGMEIMDFYFGTKDGVDTISTGHPAERKVDNPNLWDEEDWVTSVFEKLNEYERHQSDMA